MQTDAQTVVDDPFLSADPTRRPGWTGTRIKSIRHEPLRPGGRAQLTLFEVAQAGGRPHPRLQTSLPPVDDPFDGDVLVVDDAAIPDTAEGFETWLESAWEAATKGAVNDIDMDLAPAESRQYYRNSLRTQRTARFFTRARVLLDTHVAADHRTAAHAALRRLEDHAYAGVLPYDDADTGTYHSYGKDAPFVHYLETLLDSLPADGSEAMGLLPPVQQESIRRQRRQARAHLDHLMRHKYAYEGIWEADIEKRLGGMLIDRDTRRVVSETPESRTTPTPAYEMLRVDPTSNHAHAGAWVYRSADGLHLQDGANVDVPDDQLRRVPVDGARLTFQRSPGDARLRSGVRFDWNGNGWLSPEKVGWVDWAGHCDIKAVMEQLGITLTGTEHKTSVTEYRSDTGQTTTYTRDLLVEMVASAMELGSLYTRSDGSGVVRRGLTQFGGARNDSRPDRLQFAGRSRRQGLRWPLSQRQDTLVVKAIEKDGQALDLDRVFHRWIPVDDALDFEANPLFEKTIEGDYSLLDISGSRVEAVLQEDGFDDAGYPTRTPLDVVIDLREDAPESAKRVYLGAQLHDASRRTLWKVWLDVDQARVDAKVVAVERDADGAWTETEQAGEGVVLRLARPLQLTISREMKRDDPAMFRTLLDTALRTGQNICADTDMRAEVWNGVVTRIEADRVALDRARRVEHWRVKIRARFGTATLEYYMRRDARGEPQDWCPVKGESASDKQPDFLWQDFPDVGTKGVVNGDWVVNKAMLDRGIITLEQRWDMPGGVYVHDDHIKNMYEILFSSMSGHKYTIVHDNKRWGFDDESHWQGHIDQLGSWRKSRLEPDGADTVT